jgi:hypothetical protein
MRVAREILKEAAEVDAAEDELYGEKRGDELPEHLSTSQGRRGWLREAKRQLDEERAKEARPIAQAGVGALGVATAAFLREWERLVRRLGRPEWTTWNCYRCRPDHARSRTRFRKRDGQRRC